MSDTPLKVLTGGDLPSTFPRSAFEGRVTFQTSRTAEELRSAVRTADILYSGRVPENIPLETPNLRWIQVPSAGIDHLRDLPVWASAIPLAAAQGIHTVPLTEHVFAMLLGLTRQIPAMTRAQDRHEWIHAWKGSGARLTEIRDCTMGIIGWGKIGNGVAHMARAFGMRVIGTRFSVMVPREVPDTTAEAYTDPPWLEGTDAPPDVVYPASRLLEVLEQSDVVVVILPLTDETKGSIGERELAAMKRGAILINIGRGAVLDEGALVSALQSGHLAGAALDVFDTEPLPASSALWNLHNVIVSPHAGGTSERTRERAADFFAVNLSRYLQGQPLLNVVDRTQGY